MEIVKKIGKILFYIVLVIMALYSTFIIMQKIIWRDKTPEFMGYKNFVILTGSMKPTLNSGDIVVVKESNDIKENDIISFKVDNSVITHRVYDIYKENGKVYYITKGDANTGTDTELISIEDIEGKYCFRIPFLGNVILFFQKPSGIILLFGILGIYLLVSFLKSTKSQEK